MEKGYQKQRIHPPSESTAIFVRDWLLRHKKDYPYSMWKAWCAYLQTFQMKPPKLSSFMKYFYVLRKAGLVRRASPPSDPAIAKRPSPFKKRAYFELILSKLSDKEAWANPQVAVYGEKMRFGKRRYRKEVLHLPVQPRKRGRPRIRKILNFEGKPI